MYNQFDVGIQQDFDNMTLELGRNIIVYPRNDVLTYEGQESTSSGLGTGVTEIAFLQELDTTHEVVQAGEFKVGDVRIFFQSDTTAEEEGYVVANGVNYKILEFTKVRGQTNDTILYVKAFGKKVPNR